MGWRLCDAKQKAQKVPVTPCGDREALLSGLEHHTVDGELCCAESALTLGLVKWQRETGEQLGYVDVLGYVDWKRNPFPGFWS